MEEDFDGQHLPHFRTAVSYDENKAYRQLSHLKNVTNWQEFAQADTQMANENLNMINTNQQDDQGIQRHKSMKVDTKSLGGTMAQCDENRPSTPNPLNRKYMKKCIFDINPESKNIHYAIDTQYNKAEPLQPSEVMDMGDDLKYTQNQNIDATAYKMETQTKESQIKSISNIASTCSKRRLIECFDRLSLNEHAQSNEIAQVANGLEFSQCQGPLEAVDRQVDDTKMNNEITDLQKVKKKKKKIINFEDIDGDTSSDNGPSGSGSGDQEDEDQEESFESFESLSSCSSAYNKRCRFLFPDYHEDKMLRKQFISNKNSPLENDEGKETQCQIYPFIQEHLNIMTNQQRVFKKGIRRNLPNRTPIPRNYPFKFVDPLLEKIDANKESRNFLIYLKDQKSQQIEIASDMCDENPMFQIAVDDPNQDLNDLSKVEGQHVTTHFIAQRFMDQFTNNNSSAQNSNNQQLAVFDNRSHREKFLHAQIGALLFNLIVYAYSRGFVYLRF